MKHKCTLTWVLLFSLILTMGTMTAFAAVSPKAGQSLSKASDDNIEGVFDGNRIYTYMRNNGQIVYHHGGNSGCYWPGRASLQTINYASGMWVAGKVEGVPVTACAEYSSEWAAGKVLADGTPDDMYDPKYKFYKVNKADGLDPQSNPDWMNWPVEDGAPFIDANGNGTYDPLDGDMPDMQGSDQMIWYVMNDLVTEKHDNLFSSQPIGLECRVSIWGYNRPDEFGDMMFAKFQLFNKKSTTVDSCYLGIWADVDLGDAGDDFVGCDTTLGLGYTYNDGEDGVYGVAAPAIGYDFFQGAIVPAPGDTAKGWGTYFPDMKNLGMSTFSKYINGDDDYPDPESAQECWNYMAGYRYDGTKFINPLTQEPMWPVLYAPDDPVEGTGWLDAVDHPSGDRRQLQACGPFTLAPGDSQEIVTAMIIAQGSDALGSIQTLKLADTKAQIAYDIDFALPPSPPTPVVNVKGLDGKIILTWDNSAEDYMAEDPVDLDADGNPTEYAFQGYNVYQLETNTGLGASTRIGTYDLVDLVQNIKDFVFVPALGEVVERTTQYGTDSGVSRHAIIESDVLRGNAPLINNRPYYFAVTAYGYNELGVPKTLESAMTVLEVYPKELFGEKYVDISATDDTTIVVGHVGPSQGGVVVSVVDPSAVTGDDYKVTFSTNDDDETVWDLTNTTTGQVVLDDQVHQGSDDQFTVVDGLLVKVQGPPPGMLACDQVANANGPVDPPDNVWGSLSTPGDEDLNGRFVVSAQGDYEGDLSRAHDYEIRFTEKGSIACSAFSTGNYYHVPFEIWDIGFDTPDDPSDDEQMMAAMYEDAGTADVFEMVNGDATDALFGLPCSDRIYMYYVDAGGVTYADYENALVSGDTASADNMWGMTYNRPFGRIVLINYSYLLADEWPADKSTNPSNGTVIRFLTNKPNSPADTYTFSTGVLAATSSDEYAMEDVKKINVFPNPYFGANVEEVQPLEHFVRFTHLPPDGATIRIFTLAGELVREIEHDNQTQYEEWDMLNAYEVPVASGMYIVHVDCGDLGEKVLKMAVITAEERLRQW